MTALYLDSSAFVKVVIAEPESGDLAGIVSYDDRMVEAARLLGLPTTSPT